MFDFIATLRDRLTTPTGAAPTATLETSLHTSGASLLCGSASLAAVQRIASGPPPQLSPALIFFSFDEFDRWSVWRIRNQAIDPGFDRLDFDVAELALRTTGATPDDRRRMIRYAMLGTTATIVLVGEHTHLSDWVADEVAEALAAGRPVHAIRLPDTTGPVPRCLENTGIPVEDWSEATLQRLAVRPS